MIKPYLRGIEAQMQELYNRLPEKSRCLYAGVEALKLPYVRWYHVDCSRDTVRLGIK